MPWARSNATRGMPGVRVARLCAFLLALLAAAPVAAGLERLGGGADPERWETVTAGAGTVAPGDDGSLVLDVPDPEDAAFLLLREPLARDASALVLLCVRSSRAGTASRILSLEARAAGVPPAPGPDATAPASFRLVVELARSDSVPTVRFGHDAGDASLRRHWAGTPDDEWTAAGGLADAVDRVRRGPDADWNVVGLELDGSRGAARCLLVHRVGSGLDDPHQGAKLVALSDWVDVDAPEGDELRLIVGDPATDEGRGIQHFDWIRIDEGPSRVAVTNAKSRHRDPYRLRFHRGPGPVFVPAGRAGFVFDELQGAWDRNGYRKKAVLRRGEDDFVLLYEGFDADGASTIGLATAPGPAGPWLPAAGNPVVDIATLGEVDATYDVLTAPWIVEDAEATDPSARWKLFVTGEVAGTATHRIFLLEGPDPAGPWERVPGPGPDGSVLGEAEDGGWRAGGANDPVIWRDEEAGVWRGLVSGIHPDDGWTVGLVRSNDLVTWQEAPGNPVVAPAARPVGWTAVDGRFLEVEDASDLAPGAFVVLRNRSSFETLGYSRIRRIDGNRLELYHRIAGLGGDSSDRALSMLGSSSITPHALLREGDRWVLYVSVFQPFIRGTGSFGNFEGAARLTAPALEGPWSFDHLASPSVPLHRWDAARQNENLALVHGPGGRTLAPGAPPPPPPEPRFRRGDADGSGRVDTTDAVRILDWLFRDARGADCFDAGDANDSGVVDISDAITVLLHLFGGGGALPAPGGTECGTDPTSDTLGPCVSAACS